MDSKIEPQEDENYYFYTSTANHDLNPELVKYQVLKFFGYGVKISERDVDKNGKPLENSVRISLREDEKGKIKAVIGDLDMEGPIDCIQHRLFYMAYAGYPEEILYPVLDNQEAREWRERNKFFISRLLKTAYLQKAAREENGELGLVQMDVTSITYEDIATYFDHKLRQFLEQHPEYAPESYKH